MKAQLQRALMLHRQGRHKLAEQEFRHVLSEYPDQPLAHAGLAFCLLSQESFAEATEEAQLSIAADPNGAFGHYTLATVLQGRNSLGEARAAISEAIRLDPEDASCHERLAAIEFAAGRWQECLNAAEDGLRIDPEEVDCLSLRAQSLVKLGRTEEARESMSAALSLEPENSRVHLNQGRTLFMAGDTEAAAEHFLEALRLSPNQTKAREGLVECLKARNPIYRAILRGLLWMQSFSDGLQIALLFGLSIGSLTFAWAIDAVPGAERLILPVTLTYIFIVWIVWNAPSLFSLSLWMDPFGKRILLGNEKFTAVFTATCTLVSITVGLFGHYYYPDLAILYWQTAGLFAGLAIPVAKAAVQPPRRQVAMAILSLLIATAIGVTSVELLGVTDAVMKTPWVDTEAAAEEFASSIMTSYNWWWRIGFWTIALSPWIAAGTRIIPERR